MSITLDRAAARAGDLAAERRARAGERLLTCEGLFHLYVLDGREVVALQGVDLGVDWCELVALPAIPQFVDRPSVPPPIYTPDWVALGVALGLGVLLVAAGLAIVVAGLVRQARPALLREEEP